MFLELLISGQHRNKNIQFHEYHEHYYYFYTPESQSITIVLSASPQTHHVNITHDYSDEKSNKLRCMHLDLKKKIMEYGVELVHFIEHEKFGENEDKRALEIKGPGLFQLKNYAYQRPNNQEIQRAVARLVFLETLNLKTLDDLIDEISLILEHKHPSVDYKNETKEGNTTYLFFVKEKCAPKMVAQIIQFLQGSINRLVHHAPTIIIDVMDGGEVKHSLKVDENDYKSLKDLVEQKKVEKTTQVYKIELTADEIAITDIKSAMIFFEKKFPENFTLNYVEKKNKLDKVVTVCQQIQNLDELVKVYDHLQIHLKNKLNIHKHYFLDLITGTSNTDSWQKAMAQIRRHAVLLLNKKLSKYGGDNAKIVQDLMAYKKLPIFSEHHSNNVLRFFYKPNSLCKIEQVIESRSQQLNHSRNSMR